MMCWYEFGNIVSDVVCCRFEGSAPVEYLSVRLLQLDRRSYWFVLADTQPSKTLAKESQ